MVTKHLVRLGLFALVAPALAGGIAVGSVALTGAAPQASITVAASEAECEALKAEYDRQDAEWREAQRAHAEAPKDERAAARERMKQEQAERRAAKEAYESQCVEGEDPDGDEGGSPFAELCDQAPPDSEPVSGPLCEAAENFPGGGGGEPSDPQDQLCEHVPNELEPVKAPFCGEGGEFPPAPGEGDPQDQLCEQVPNELEPVKAPFCGEGGEFPPNAPELPTLPAPPGPGDLPVPIPPAPASLL